MGAAECNYLTKSSMLLMQIENYQFLKLLKTEKVVFPNHVGKIIFENSRCFTKI